MSKRPSDSPAGGVPKKPASTPVAPVEAPTTSAAAAAAVRVVFRTNFYFLIAMSR